jgi:hypothetical protein
MDHIYNSAKHREKKIPDELQEVQIIDGVLK